MSDRNDETKGALRPPNEAITLPVNGSTPARPSGDSRTIDDTQKTEAIIVEDTPVEKQRTTWTDPAWDEERPATETVVLPTVDSRDRDAERVERNRALGVVDVAPLADTEPAFTRPVKRTTDKWHGSLALFLLRLVSALIIGLHGFQHLRHLSWTTDYFSKSVLPRPEIFGLATGIVECVVAVLLLLGLMTRFAGLLLAVIQFGLLAFFIWGKVNPLDGHIIGANGELELLLGTAGLVFLLLGGGGWAVDRAYRAKRLKKKEDKALGRI